MSRLVEPRESVSLMEGYHSPQIDVKVRLNTNESPVGPPPGFAGEVAEAIRSIEWNRYPDRQASGLRSAIAGLHHTEPSRIFAANGSNEVLQTLLLTYGGPARCAAMFEPTYALHSHLSRITGTEVAQGERCADFSLDLSEVERVIDAHHPSIVFLCSPNNPTGVVDTRSEVETVLEMSAAVGALLCVDEAYAQFSPWSALSLMGSDVPLVVTRTYSKTWAMAGARLGYMIAPDWVIAEMEKVVMPYHLDSMTQIAGTLALNHLDAMESRVDEIVSERERLGAQLSQLDIYAWPSGSNFILFRPEAKSGHEVWQALVDRSVLVRNCATWPRLDGCLRVTIGTAEENDLFLETLTEVLK